MDSAISGNHLAIVEYLLDKNTRLLPESINNTIINDNDEMFLVLMRYRQFNDKMLKLAVSGGRGKILKLYSPPIDSTLISEAGHHLNIIVQLIDYQIAKAKENAAGLLANQLTAIYPKLYHDAEFYWINKIFPLPEDKLTKTRKYKIAIK